MQSRIVQALNEARQLASGPVAYPFLPAIIQALEAMQIGSSLPREHRERMAGGLGRLVTEDMEFADSSLGSSILKIADDFVVYG